MPKYLLACLFVGALAVGMLAGCAPSQQAESASSSSDVAAEPAVEHDEVSVRVCAPTSLEGMLLELSSSYTADREWLSFDIESYASSEQLNKAIAGGSHDTAGFLSSSVAASAGEAEAASESAQMQDTSMSSASDADGSADGSAAADAEGSAGVDTDGSAGESAGSADESSGSAASNLVADLVFEDSLAAMDVAEQAEVVDPATRLDMIEDSLALVVAEESDISIATTAEIQSGKRGVVVVSADDAEGVRQREVYSRLGLYEDGHFVGALAAAPDDAADAAKAVQVESSSTAAADGPVIEAKTAAEQFSLLAEHPDYTGIVRSSDLYRYGGVKVVGTVPADLYDPMRYSMALAADFEGLDNGDDVRDACQDFLRWMLTDEDAIRIIGKWGFHLAA